MKEPAYYVRDGAGYTKETIRTISESIKWVSRVPQTLQAARVISQQIAKGSMESCGEGYSITELGSVYAGVKQSRLVVFSEKRHAQAVNTIQTHVTKEACPAKKDLKKPRLRNMVVPLMQSKL